MPIDRHNNEKWAGPIPARAGVGLKAQHYQAILDETPDLGFFEVHAENYMGASGLPHHYMERIRSSYPLSVHGVGLSLGSADGVSQSHLQRLKELIGRYEPDLVSEHISWSTAGHTYLNDLLPVPYTEEVLQIVADNIDETQNSLGRQILVENPSTYVAFAGSQIPEHEFLLEIIQRTGCGLLLDVNNVFVSCENHGADPTRYLDSIPSDIVGEIHLAGHACVDVDGETFRIDDHGSAVIDEVWALYENTIKRMSHVPVLIEWDANLPDFDVLYTEAKKADQFAGRAGVEETSDAA